MFACFKRRIHSSNITFHFHGNPAKTFCFFRVYKLDISYFCHCICYGYR
ncbi:microcompartment protein [Listeria monocytogenes]|nr:microcompartment protein [Listeria monocytogenes]